jgi:hypothetical protein
MSIKLNDTQLMLLSGASQRDDRHVSLPTGRKLTHARRAAANLLEAGLAREVKTRKDAPVWRRDQDAGQAYSLKLTAAGLKAIAVDDSNDAEEAAPQAHGGDAIPNEPAHAAIDATKTAGRVEASHAATTPVSPRVGTKVAEVVALLAGESGATLDQLAAATGWLPHTTRAALTGLRKRGYAVTLGRSDRIRGSTYRIVSGHSSDGSTEEAVAAEGAVAGAAGSSQSGPDNEPARRKRRPRAMPSPPRPELARPPEMRRLRKAKSTSVLPVRPAPRVDDREWPSQFASSLLDLDRRQLLLRWRNHLGGTAPAHLPTWLLARLLAYRIQAAVLGDLSAKTLRRLRSLKDAWAHSVPAPFANRSPSTREGVDLRPGALLAREWRGRLERVTVLSEGFAWNGEIYASLSMVAKAITGTSWNGHRFFGLRSGRRPTAKAKQADGARAMAPRSEAAP